MGRGGSHQEEALHYTGEDIRYTRSKDGHTLYLITLGKPDGGSVSPEILRVGHAGKGRVTQVGHDDELPFEVNDGRLTFRVPADLPSDLAYAFKLTGFETTLAPEAQARRDAALKALAEGPIDPGKKDRNSIRFGQE